MGKRRAERESNIAQLGEETGPGTQEIWVLSPIRQMIHLKFFDIYVLGITLGPAFLLLHRLNWMISKIPLPLNG